jgi:transposase
MVNGDDYVEQGLAHYNAQILQSKRRLAKELGQKLVPIAQPV